MTMIFAMIVTRLNTPQPPVNYKSGNLNELVIREVIPWVEFKDQHVVDPGRPPTVGVDAEEEDEEDDEEKWAVHLEGRLPYAARMFRTTC